MTKIEYVMGAIMVLGVVGGLINRCCTRRGIGERFNQYIVFVLAIPATVILASEKLIGPETSAAILGAAIGFAAAVAGRELKSKPSQPKPSDSAPAHQVVK